MAIKCPFCPDVSLANTEEYHSHVSRKHKKYYHACNLLTIDGVCDALFFTDASKSQHQALVHLKTDVAGIVVDVNVEDPK